MERLQAFLGEFISDLRESAANHASQSQKNNNIYLRMVKGMALNPPYFIKPRPIVIVMECGIKDKVSWGVRFNML